MDEKDKKIRNYWLKLLIGLTTFNAISTAIFQLYFNIPPSPLPFSLRLLFVTFLVLCMFLFAYLLYRCAYKKPGTKFLTFCLVVTIISGIILPILYLSSKIPLPPIPYYGAYLFLTQVIGVVWAVACWKMREVNKKLRAQMPQS